MSWTYFLPCCYAINNNSSKPHFVKKLPCEYSPQYAVHRKNSKPTSTIHSEEGVAEGWVSNQIVAKCKSEKYNKTENVKMNMKANKIAVATTYHQLFIHPFHMTDVQFKITDKCKKNAGRIQKKLWLLVYTLHSTHMKFQKKPNMHATKGHKTKPRHIRRM